MFTISGLATETIAVTGNYVTGSSDGMLVRKALDGALIQAATLPNGTYYFDEQCPVVVDDVVFTKSAAVDSVTITGQLMP